MKTEQTGYSINQVVPLKSNIKDYVRQHNQDENALLSRCNVIGGVMSDNRYSWLANGPRLEVLYTKTGTKVAAWTFGATHDFRTSITCVNDLGGLNGKPPMLIIGLECEITGGMVCVFDVNSSRVIRAIQIDEKVTSLHVVNVGYDSSLPGALQALDGVLAVGTVKGQVLLIDLCRQTFEEVLTSSHSERLRDEVNACQLIYLTLNDLKNVEKHKEISLNNGDHLCFPLNEQSTSGMHFALHGPKGEDRLHVNKSEVTVSALNYCPQLGALLVGYNFGAFQLYNLLNIKLEYTSPVYEDCIPVTHFTVQEPCDDPRAFCYVWVVYSTTEFGDNGYPIAVMYALAYTSKDHLDGYGYLYQELVSCSVRFQLDLTVVSGSRLVTSGGGGYCIALNSYTRENTDENLTLCSMVWTVWNHTGSETYLCLFDLNQWYKEQMPANIQDERVTNYLSCVSLNELMCSAEEILHVRLDSSSINSFVSVQRLEEHYQPSALSFRALCLCPQNVVWFNTIGLQRFLLSQLEMAGPLGLLRPTELYHRCVQLGLTPFLVDVPIMPSAAMQREFILSVALEHQLVHWLCACARNWSDGSQSSCDCTLDFLLKWAWQRANLLKRHADKICVPLFDHAGTRLDANAHNQLNHCACQLRHLATIFETALRFIGGDLNVESQWRAIEMVAGYLEVLQWLLNVGLLPECPLIMYPRPDELERVNAPYPVESLMRFYRSHRAKLREESGVVGGEEKSCDLLFIDNLIDLECGGVLLRKQWESDGGSGLYPPPSLQALLRTYLLEDIDIVYKHCLFVYLFLDLAMTLDQNRYKPIITHLIKFPAVFKISPSIIKITQAFWQLDHGDFSTAMTQLLDPAVNNDDLKPWHHRIVLRSLLLQGQHQHALLYYQIRKPAITNIRDTCIIITLLTINDMLQEAFHLQRQHRSIYNEKELIRHFFTICDETNQLSSILHLPLCPLEEKEFIDYLKVNRNEANENLLVIYYLQRDRYTEAFAANDLFNKNEVLKQGLLGQKYRNFRNVIVSGFKKTLPVVTQALLDYCNQKKDVLFRKMEEPVPMSVFVHNANEQVRYKSTLIQASFQKAKETWTKENDDRNHFDDTPFLSTPKIFTEDKTRTTPITIYPSTVDVNKTMRFNDDLDEAIAAKRIKLSPRQAIGISAERNNRFEKRLESPSLLDTPIIKRKSYRSDSITKSESSELFNHAGTPTSILKVRTKRNLDISPETQTISLRDTSVTPENLDEIDCASVSGIEQLENSQTLENSQKPKRKSLSFGIAPRRSIQRTPRPGVRFNNDTHTKSKSFSDESGVDGIDISLSRETKNDSQQQTPTQFDSKNSSESTEDQFYSPNTSLSDSNSSSSNLNKSELVVGKSINLANVLEESSEAKRMSLKRKLTTTPVQPRRSYQESPATPTTDIRDALRSQDKKTLDVFPKLSGRRSLSRQVLEQNTITKVLASPRMQTRLSVTKLATPNLTDNDKKIGMEVSYSKSTTSIVKTTTDNLIEESCDKLTMEHKDVYSKDKQSTKHVHNESIEKSHRKKVTEILSPDEEDRVLSSSSELDDDDDVKMTTSYESHNHDNDQSSLFTIDKSINQSDCSNHNDEQSLSDDVIDIRTVLNTRNNLSQTVFHDISEIQDESDEEMDVDDTVANESVVKTKENTDVILSEQKQEDIKTTTVIGEIQEEDVNDKINVEETVNNEELKKLMEADRNEDIVEIVSNQETNEEEDVNDKLNVEDEETVAKELKLSEEENELMEADQNEDIEEIVSSQETNDEASETSSSENIEKPELSSENECEQIEEEETENEEETSDDHETSEDNEEELDDDDDVIEIKSSSDESSEELKLNITEELNLNIEKFSAIDESSDPLSSENKEEAINEDIIIEERVSNDPLEQNVIEEYTETISDDLPMETTEIDPLEQNIIEEHSQNIEKDSKSVHSDSIIIDKELIPIEIDPLEQNIIKEHCESRNIEKDSIIIDKELTSCDLAMKTTEIDPLEQNVIEENMKNDSIIIDKEFTPCDSPMKTTEIDPLKQNAIEENMEKDSIIIDKELTHRDSSMKTTEIDPLEQENVICGTQNMEKSSKVVHSEPIIDKEITKTTEIDPREQNISSKVVNSEPIIDREIIIEENCDTQTLIETSKDLNSEETQHIKQSTHQSDCLIEICKTLASTDSFRSDLKVPKTDILSKIKQFHKTTLPVEELKTKTRSSSKVSTELKGRKRLRSASVDLDEAEKKPPIPSARITRSKSVEKTLNTDLTTKRVTRRTPLPKIEEKAEDKPIARRTRAASTDVEMVQEKLVPTTRSRRGASVEPTSAKELESELVERPRKRTRKQSTKSDVIDELNIDRIDPIHLLDKESFAGIPDSDEHNLRSISRASSVDTQITTPTRVSTRRQSRLSSTTTTPEKQDEKPMSNSATIRSRRKSFTQAQAAISTPTKRPYRRRGSQDTDSSDVSSVISVPVVKIEPIMEKELFRHRSLSPTMLQKETIASPTNTRRKSKRITILPQIDLSKIAEESTSSQDTAKTDGVNVIDKIKTRRTRSKKKLESERQSIDQLWPKYTGIKTRKTFKIRTTRIATSK